LAHRDKLGTYNAGRGDESSGNCEAGNCELIHESLCQIL